MHKLTSKDTKVFKPCKRPYIAICTFFLLMPLVLIVTAIVHNTYNSLDTIKAVLFSFMPLPITVFCLWRYKVIIDPHTVTLAYVFGSKSVRREEISRVEFVVENGKGISPTIYIYTVNNNTKPVIKIRIANFSSEDALHMEQILKNIKTTV